MPNVQVALSTIRYARRQLIHSGALLHSAVRRAAAAGVPLPVVARESGLELAEVRAVLRHPGDLETGGGPASP